MGTPQRRRRIKRRFGRLAVQRRSLTRQGLARRRALHPPRRLIPNLTTGAMRNCLARAWPAPVSGALFGAIRGFTPSPLGLSHWSVPATTGGSVEPHTHHRRPLHASALLAPRPHGGRNGAHCPGQYGLSCNCRHEAHAQLPDPILQIFNSRLVGLGKCRMNQVSSQSGRMYKASRCPAPFWHESSLETSSGIVGFTFTSGFINC